MPQLEDGPKSLEQLGVPRYALQHLERAGLVRMRTRTERTAKCTYAVQVWYLPDCPGDCNLLDLRILEEIERQAEGVNYA